MFARSAVSTLEHAHVCIRVENGKLVSTDARDAKVALAFTWRKRYTVRTFAAAMCLVHSLKCIVGALDIVYELNAD